MTDSTPIEQGRLNRYLDEFAVEQLQKYFTSGDYVGGRFETFAGGGDRAETANRFTYDDIIAVSLVGARIPGRAALEILEDRSDEFGDLLGQMPLEVDLWDVPETTIGAGSAADTLRLGLVEVTGMSPFAASKLMARKRPRLIPMYDRVLKVALERNDVDDWWVPLRAALAGKQGTDRSGESALVVALTQWREDSRIGTDYSILRVLYACIWMREFGRELVPEVDR